MAEQTKYTNAEVAEIVDNEGLGYSIASYLSAGNIEDPQLAALWEIADAVLTRIENILDKEVS